MPHATVVLLSTSHINKLSLLIISVFFVGSHPYSLLQEVALTSYELLQTHYEGAKMYYGSHFLLSEIRDTWTTRSESATLNKKKPQR